MKRNYYRKASDTTPPRLYCFCSGRAKISYASAEEANAARNRHRRHGLQLTAYQCRRQKAANVWHLTSRVY